MNLKLFRGRTLPLVASAIVFLPFIATQASASSVVVGTCTPGVQFVTIQAAITSAPSGATIKICPGTYPEQIHINKKLTLTGIPSGTPPTQSDAVIITLLPEV